MHVIGLAVLCLLVTAFIWPGRVASASEGWSPTPFCETDKYGVKNCLVVERGWIRGLTRSETKVYLAYSCTDDVSPEARAWNQSAQATGRPRSEWAPSGESIMLTIPVWEGWASRFGIRTRNPRLHLRWSNGERERVKTRFERFDREEPEGVSDLMWHIEDTESFIAKVKRSDRLDIRLPFSAADRVNVRFRFVNALPSIQRAMKECGLVHSALGDIR